MAEVLEDDWERMGRRFHGGPKDDIVFPGDQVWTISTPPVGMRTVRLPCFIRSLTSNHVSSSIQTESWIGRTVGHRGRVRAHPVPEPRRQAEQAAE